MKLITESNYDVIIESTNGGKDLYISGVFSSAEVPVLNGRTYRKPVLEREIKKIYETQVKNKCAWGELEHPQRPNVDLNNAAILIEELNWHGNDVAGKAIVLNTEKGKTLKALMEHGKVGISSRGLGTVNEDGYVNENFRLITYDVVGTASNPASRFVNGILESEEFFTKEELERLNDEKSAQTLISEQQNKEKMLQEAREVYKKHIWQVLKNLERSI